jgi:4-aminobutyrate aminotransferase-like enzyme
MGTGVALEVIKILEEEDFETEITSKGKYFLNGLQDLKKRHKIVGDVDGLGLALRIEICKAVDSFTPDKKMMDWLEAEALKGDLAVNGRKYGLVLDVGGYHKNVITLAPALTLSLQEIDLALSLLDQLFARAGKK